MLRNIPSKLLIAIGVVSSCSVQATLVDRGGGLIYDTALNVTWLQDANYAKTTHYAGANIAGQMTWSQALTWADQLSFYDSVRNVTWTDWRLPKNGVLDPQVGWQMAVTTDGSQDDGYNVSAPGTKYAGSTAKELPYLFFNSLGNSARCPVTGGFAACSTGDKFSYTLNAGPFINLDRTSYWTGSNQNVVYQDAWAFDMGAQWGLIGAMYVNAPRLALAVRDGDVAAVPEASTLAMLLAGLAVVGFGARRRAAGSRPA